MRHSTARTLLQTCHTLCRVRGRAAAADAAAPKSILFLGFEWPEPASSAAGVRTVSLIAAAQAVGWSVAVGAAASPTAASAALARRGVPTHRVPLNRSNQLDAVLQATRPDVVIFDRFIAEEAFSWRVRETLPAAARVLDMQDCHALRRARGVAASAALRAGHCPVTAALAAWPDAADADAAREWAAIARSDTVLVCSPVEHAWLIKTLGVPPAKLVLAPLFARTRARPTAALPLSHRAGFVSVGSFLHPPNVEGLAWYLDAPDGWRSLRAELGKERAQLDICGSYAHERQAVTAALHRPALGVHVRGHAPNLSPIARARVLLAPLTYGAGLKGKLIDAWRRGTPAVTTPIGSEGLRVEDWKQLEDGTPGSVPPPAALHDITGWGGASDCVTPADITAAAVRLATDDTA